MKKVLRDEISELAAMSVAALQQRHPIPVVQELIRRGWRMKEWTTRKGAVACGQAFAKNRLYNLLTNMVYVGKVEYGGQVYEGEHEAIVDPEIWQRVQDRLRYNGRTAGRQIRNLPRPALHA